MPKKIAIDWDEQELRLVAAQCSGNSVKVTDVAVIPLGESSVSDTLRDAVAQRGLESTDTLIAIGRGRAELRELQLPPVPDDELPQMVRFQAIKSFASAGDRATVDYLVTRRSERGIEMIAAAVGPESLTEIRESCESAELTIKRIGLRPLAAAALYLTRKSQEQGGDIVLIDLLADDAEIVVARDGHVIFVRTVRMPSVVAARPKALAGELRRSLVACGSSGSLDRVVLWGLESVHRDDLEMLAEASGSQVEVLSPFDLVDVDKKVRAELPDHVGRLAPLVGLIASDELHGDRLIDFLNPRQKAEEKPDTLKKGLMVGVPIAALLLLAFFSHRYLKDLDAKILALKNANAQMKPDVDEAFKRIDKTEKVDLFLDADVNWLAELRRLATSMPPSEQMIVRNVSGSGDARKGGGTLQITGAVTDPSVLKLFEESLRDDAHQVVGDGSTQQKTEDAYKFTAVESITVTPDSIRNSRYEGLSPEAQSEAAQKAESELDSAASEANVVEESPPDESPPDDSPTVESGPDESAADVAEVPAVENGQPNSESVAPQAEAPAVETESSQPAEPAASEEPETNADAESKADSETREQETPPADLAVEPASEVKS